MTAVSPTAEARFWRRIGFRIEETPEGGTVIHTTLLALVTAVSELTDDDREVVATVSSLLASGRVRLCGSFRDEPVDQFRP